MHCFGNGYYKTTLEPVWRSQYIRLKVVCLKLFIFTLILRFIHDQSYIDWSWIKFTIPIAKCEYYPFLIFCIFAFCGLQVAAMFKIGNSKELPAIPDHLSQEGKDFVWQCLQRNPLHRPSAAQLLDHPFVKHAAPLERPILSPTPSDPSPPVTSGVKTLVWYSKY